VSVLDADSLVLVLEISVESLDVVSLETLELVGLVVGNGDSVTGCTVENSVPLVEERLLVIMDPVSVMAVEDSVMELLVATNVDRVRFVLVLVLVFVDLVTEGVAAAVVDEPVGDVDSVVDCVTVALELLLSGVSVPEAP
jgi:hypothetical protein